MLKIIRGLATVIRFIALMIAGLGLVGCVLAQKSGSFWDQNYMVAFNATEISSYIIGFCSTIEFSCRIMKATEKTLFFLEKLYLGIFLMVVPIIFVAFFIPDLRALHVATFIAGIGSIIFSRSLPKEPDRVVEVETTIYD